MYTADPRLIGDCDREPPTKDRRLSNRESFIKTVLLCHFKLSCCYASTFSDRQKSTLVLFIAFFFSFDFLFLSPQSLMGGSLS